MPFGVVRGEAMREGRGWQCFLRVREANTRASKRWRAGERER